MRAPIIMWSCGRLEKISEPRLYNFTLRVWNQFSVISVGVLFNRRGLTGYLVLDHILKLSSHTIGKNSSLWTEKNDNRCPKIYTFWWYRQRNFNPRLLFSARKLWNGKVCVSEKISWVNKQSRSCFLLLKVHLYLSTTPYSTCFTRRQDLEVKYP